MTERELINRWFGLLSPTERKRCPECQGPLAPMQHRNLYWWVEEWMDHDLMSIEQLLTYSDSEEGEIDGAEWTYTIKAIGPLKNYSNANRAIALFEAAIGVAKRRRK